MLRWNDDVIDIREQYPLALDATRSICKSLGFRHPGNGHMTTDFLVDYRDGTRKAFSIKDDPSALSDPRTVEKQYVEMEYWKTAGIPFYILYKSDLDRTTIHNIMDVISCYSRDSVFDEFSQIRHMIAHKIISVNMSKRIDYPALIRQYKEELQRGWTDNSDRGLAVSDHKL